MVCKLGFSTRKLKAIWGLEAEQDLSAIHGLDKFIFRLLKENDDRETATT